MALQEIETQIAQLSPADLAEFAAWFEKFHDEAWDSRLEQDSRAGRLDALISQANEAFDSGRCKPL